MCFCHTLIYSQTKEKSSNQETKTAPLLWHFVPHECKPIYCVPKQCKMWIICKPLPVAKWFIYIWKHQRWCVKLTGPDASVCNVIKHWKCARMVSCFFSWQLSFISLALPKMCFLFEHMRVSQVKLAKFCCPSRRNILFCCVNENVPRRGNLEFKNKNHEFINDIVMQWILPFTAEFTHLFIQDVHDCNIYKVYRILKYKQEYRKIPQGYTQLLIWTIRLNVCVILFPYPAVA